MLPVLFPRSSFLKASSRMTGAIAMHGKLVVQNNLRQPTSHRSYVRPSLIGCEQKTWPSIGSARFGPTGLSRLRHQPNLAPYTEHRRPIPANRHSRPAQRTRERLNYILFRRRLAGLGRRLRCFQMCLNAHDAPFVLCSTFISEGDGQFYRGFVGYGGRFSPTKTKPVKPTTADIIYRLTSVRPSRMAYLVSSATLKRFSFSMI